MSDTGASEPSEARGATQDAAPTAGPSVRQLLVMSVPAIAIGVGSAVTLWVLNSVAGLLETYLWQTLPAVFGADESTPWWIFTMLTLIGAAVGLVVWLVPGHGGPDSATTELSGPFPGLKALPSIALVVVLGLAGGVSLGPENPIIAINAALSMALLAKAAKVPQQLIAALAIAGTIGALFGTPVAAALVFTGMVGAMKSGGSLWDRLFLPLAAAGAGAATMDLLGGEAIAFHLEPMGALQPIYLLTGLVIAAAAALLGIVGAWVFPYVHRAFHALRNPLIITTLGGAVLGLLGVLGGPITLFKGLEQTGELLKNPDDYTPGQLAAFAGIKMVAMLIAASAGFRGGRIFPVVFVGAALGLFGSAVIPDLPISLGVACAIMGVTLAATRDGWISIFIGVALVGDVAVIAPLCLIVLPVWLMVTKAPELLIKPRPAGVSVRNPDRPHA
ncbi:H+/Cl-antiporter ClcA [Agromyces sp. CF514]|uniref:ion channel protein n=1 Tax=Agromyces sp. CF514 TaxID=1881031 RepID=UPI0008F27C0F|nr:ion channel protein [Agromyces sp. CF514]SFR67776.1 H+/Cl-antiporter ClcA [Agromyces sp. CF514]